MVSPFLLYWKCIALMVSCVAKIRREWEKLGDIACAVHCTHLATMNQIH